MLKGEKLTKKAFRPWFERNIRETAETINVLKARIYEQRRIREKTKNDWSSRIYL